MREYASQLLAAQVGCRSAIANCTMRMRQTPRTIKSKLFSAGLVLCTRNLCGEFALAPWLAPPGHSCAQKARALLAVALDELHAAAVLG